MSAAARVLVVLPVVVACVLGLGGCRGGGDRAALPEVSTPAVHPPTVSTVAASTPAVRSGSGAAAGDPLAGIESEVDAVERDVDSDSDAGSAPGR
jgi:hypothetical protein